MTDHVAEAVLVYLRRLQHGATVLEIAEALHLDRGDVRRAIRVLYCAHKVTGIGGPYWRAV